MSFVVDSSVTLAWVYLDEMTPAILRLSQEVSKSGAWAPAIWRLEVGNSLQMSLRRGRIDTTFRDKALANLSELRISIDPETDTFAWTTTLDLCGRFGLTLYDACYLELAQRRSLALATLDKDLRTAGEALNLPLLGI